MAVFQISLAAARVNANMTQDDTAKAMKVSKTTVVNWEKGKVVRSLDWLNRIMNCLKMF